MRRNAISRSITVLVSSIVLLSGCQNPVSPTQVSKASSQMVKLTKKTIKGAKAVLAPAKQTMYKPEEETNLVLEEIVPQGFSVKSEEELVSGDVIPHRFIIKLTQSNSDFLNQWEVSKLGDIRKSDNVILAESYGWEDQQLIDFLSQDPRIEYIEQDRLIKLNGYSVDDPYFNHQYAHQKMETAEAWDIARAKGLGFGEEVMIAIVDSGIDANHEDFKAKRNHLIAGYSITGGDALNPLTNHGTHCAGIAAAPANNGKGVAGVAPAAKLMSVRVFDNGSASSATVAAGITYAANSEAKVISMSLGGPYNSRSIRDAVTYAASKNKIMVAAMGNDGNNTRSYPAALPEVIAVGSTNSSDNKSGYSQFGDWISVSAPGSSIMATLKGSRYGYMSGTSMATPQVAGLAAMLLSIKPDMSRQEVQQLIESSSDDLGSAGFDNDFGHGRINVKRAVNALWGQSPQCTMSSPIQSPTQILSAAGQTLGKYVNKPGDWMGWGTGFHDIDDNFPRVAIPWNPGPGNGQRDVHGNGGGPTGILQTGLYKTIPLQYAQGDKLWAMIGMIPTFTSSDSSATAVLTFDDPANTVVASTTLRKYNSDLHVVHINTPIPDCATKVTINLLGYLGSDEQSSVQWEGVHVEQWPANYYKPTTLFDDGFDEIDDNQYGTNSPITVDQEYGFDFYGVTNWPEKYSGDKAITAVRGQSTHTYGGLIKRIPLNNLKPGSLLNTKLFTSTTFNDPTSEAYFWVKFYKQDGSANGGTQSFGTFKESQYGWLSAEKVNIPSDSAYVEIIPEVKFGPAETSSFLWDHLNVEILEP